MNTPKDKCVICNRSIALRAYDKRWLHGNNAEPVKSGQCCDPCNEYIVVPTRITQAIGLAKVHEPDAS